MGVLPVRGEEEPGADLAEDRGQLTPVFQGWLQAPIEKSEILTPWIAERGICRRGLGRPGFEAPQRGWLTGRQVKNPDLPSFLKQSGNRSTKPELGIVGLWRHHKSVENRAFFFFLT